jgi:hypothetical protein
MLSVIEKDILDIDEGLIVHQVNCRGKMGTGLAGSLRTKYPAIYKKYIELYNSYLESGETIKILGTSQIVPISTKLKVVNAFTQFNYGYDGKQYTDYDAIEEVFTRLKIVNLKKLPVYIPYQYGSGLGGGNFKVISEIIESVYPETIICKRKDD